MVDDIYKAAVIKLEPVPMYAFRDSTPTMWHHHLIVEGQLDYSQGIRLVYRKIKVGRTWMDYTDVFNHPLLKKLLCDEEFCDFYRYNY